MNLWDPLATCQKLHMCESPNVMEMLYDVMPVDLSQHIEHVNNKNTSWVAGENEKFTGMSHK